MSAYKITRLTIFPIKSLGGIDLEKSQVNSRGLEFDRQWMLVNEKGEFLTQREHHEMALFKLSDAGHHFVVSKAGQPDLKLEKYPTERPEKSVQVWSSKVKAWHIGEAADEWFSDAMGQYVHLVYMPQTTSRKVNFFKARNQDEVRFSDGYPTLIIGEAALELLNSKLETPVRMDNFRPNIVFSGGEPHDEDEWPQFKVGPITFFGVKKCSRCVVVTIDQETGKKMPYSEPLRTLVTYRKKNWKKIMFGQNLLHDGTGEIATGMEIAF